MLIDQIRHAVTHANGNNGRSYCLIREDFYRVCKQALSPDCGDLVEFIYEDQDGCASRKSAQDKSYFVRRDITLVSGVLQGVAGFAFRYNTDLLKDLAPDRTEIVTAVTDHMRREVLVTLRLIRRDARQRGLADAPLAVDHSVLTALPRHGIERSKLIASASKDVAPVERS